MPTSTEPDPPPSTPVGPPPSVYGLTAPTVPDAHAVVTALFPLQAPRLWPDLLAAAGLRGDERDEASVSRLLDAMTGDDPLLRLCATSLRIRLVSFTELAQAQDILRSAR